MKKEIRSVGDGIVRVTTVDERWYVRQEPDAETGLPERTVYVPSVTWITSHYPKGKGFWIWLASKGWDEAEAIKAAAGDKGSRVHHAIVDLLDGEAVPMDAVYPGADGQVAELSLEEYDCLLAFQDWWATMKPETLAREVVVWNDEYGYAGTVDWIGLLHGAGRLPVGPWVLDWKTSQEIWPAHELQVSAYRHTAQVSEYCLAGPEPPPSLGILQLGYRRNKARWKFTPVADQFPLFLAARQIWAKETDGERPLQREYPLRVRLA